MRAGHDIVGIGICTVDHLMVVPQMPGDNQNMRVSTYLRQSGGLASSALAAAARLGAKTKIIARIGDDGDGEYIRRDLEREGVDTALLLSAAGTGSTVAVILVNAATGERSIVSRAATGPPIAPQDIPRAVITGARSLFIDAHNPATLQAARWAREAGRQVVLDPAQPYAQIRAILPYVTVPIVPEQWAREWLPGQPPQAAAQALHQAGAETAIVTLGERGAVVCSAAGLRAYPAFAVDVVDTTGAGDAFHGAFMYALLQDWELPRCVRFAAAVGSLNCRALGGRTALPSRPEVDAFLARQR